MENNVKIRFFKQQRLIVLNMMACKLRVIALEWPNILSFCCNYNATVECNKGHNILNIQCYSKKDTWQLYNDLKEYFYAK